VKKEVAMGLQRLFETAAILACTAVSAVRAQTPPPPGTPASQIQRLIDARGLRTLLIRRIESSHLTADQIRQRLAQLGYDPTTLDPYLDEAVKEPPEPSPGVLEAVQALGVVAAPVKAADDPAPEDPLRPGELLLSSPPSGAAPVLPPPTAEERAKNLRVFGLEVFGRNTTQFQPVTTGPVPPSYVVGPGDELVLALTGDVEFTYRLPVSREGFILIPQIGQVWVNGLTLEGLRKQMYAHLGKAYSGIADGPGATAFFDISLGRLRTNQVFVTGEVARPGNYLVSPVASVLNALYLAGGPTANGSFRDVRLIKNDGAARDIDLYDYLLGGDNLADIHLEPGDVIFVPVHGDHVSIRGEIVREAIYELKPDETLYHLMEHAGGVTTPAHLRRARITRILPPTERRVPGVDRVVIDADLGEVLADTGAAPRLEPGDDVRVFAVRSEVRNVVTLAGSVWQEGSFGFADGMRAWDLIGMGEGLTPEAYLPTAQIERLNLVDSTLSIIPFSLDTLEDGTPREDPALSEFDVVRVFSRARFEPAHRVEVRGAVRDPGPLTRFENMTLHDAILYAGGLNPKTFTRRAYISRLQADSTRRVLPVRLEVDSLMIPVNADTLQDFDIIEVYGISRFTDEFPVTISGEVRQPGTEKFQEGMTLRDLIVRAGGLRPVADLTVEVARLVEPAQRSEGRITKSLMVRVDSSYIVPEEAVRFYLGDLSPPASDSKDHAAELVLRPYDQVFVRRIPHFEMQRTVTVSGEVVYPGAYSLRRKDERLRELVVDRAGGLTPTAHAAGFQLYRNGRLVNVEFEKVLEDASQRDNLVLLPGDSVVIPEYNPVVVVQGAVNSPSTVLYRHGEGLGYYIENAGGYAENADEGRTHVRYANGAMRVKHRFLFFGSSPEPGPGSVVTVPAEPEKEGSNTASIVASITQVLVTGATLAIVAIR
jgi:polysaccharide export outer membrane protein